MADRQLTPKEVFKEILGMIEDIYSRIDSLEKRVEILCDGVKDHAANVAVQDRREQK